MMMKNVAWVLYFQDFQHKSSKLENCGPANEIIILEVAQALKFDARSISGAMKAPQIAIYSFFFSNDRVSWPQIHPMYPQRRV